jgi:uncharacterized protein YraI
LADQFPQPAYKMLRPRTGRGRFGNRLPSLEPERCPFLNRGIDWGCSKVAFGHPPPIEIAIRNSTRVAMAGAASCPARHLLPSAMATEVAISNRTANRRLIDSATAYLMVGRRLVRKTLTKKDANMNTRLIFGTALIAGLLSTGAIAAEAVSGANVRSGPGTSYPVVDQLSAGENVTVTRCVQGGWCLINHPGPDGWVSANLLADNGNDDDYFNEGGGRVAVADDVKVLEDEDPDVRVRFGFGFGFGDRFVIGRPGGRGDLVCLVTFFRRGDVESGRDVDVQRAEVLPRRVAELRDRRNDRRSIFDYGSDRQTIRTCRYLDRLN